MKKITSLFSTLAVFAALFTITACSKEDVIVIQNLADQSVCLPQNQFQSVNKNNSFTVTQSDIAAVFQAAGATYSPDKVKAMKLSEIKAQITTNAATFNEIEGFEVYAKGPNSTGNGIQVAYINNIANNATEITLLINGEELKSLLSETSITFTAFVTNKAAGNAEVCFKLTGGKLEYKLSAE